MAYSLAQKPNTENEKRRVKNRGAVDAQELSRLLNRHLEKQAIRSEQRRLALAAKAAVEPYVPRVAASAFERTTTPDAMRQIHKLSQPAVKQHLEILHVDIPSLSLMRMQVYDQVVVERNALRNRNQWQWTHEMEQAAEFDLDREVDKPPRRTFAELEHLMKTRSREEQILKGGDSFWHEGPSKMKSRTAVCVPDFEGRNDWAQKEEMEGGGRRTLLKRDTTSWIARRREKRQAEAVKIGDGSPPTGNRRERGRGLLGRFSRY